MTVSEGADAIAAALARAQNMLGTCSETVNSVGLAQSEWD